MQTRFDTEQRACTQPAAFLIPFSQCKCKTSSTYVYTSFASDLVLVKSVAVDKTSRQTLLFNHLPYWPHIAWAHCHTKLSTHYILSESTICSPWRSIGTRPSPNFSPQLRDKIWVWPGNKPTLTLAINKMWALKAYSACSRKGSQFFLTRQTWLYNAIHTWQSKKAADSLSVKLLSFWVMQSPYPTHKPQTQLFCSYFYSCFHLHNNGCAIYRTHGRFCFHHGQNRMLYTLPPPSAIKLTSSSILAKYLTTLVQLHIR